MYQDDDMFFVIEFLTRAHNEDHFQFLKKFVEKHTRIAGVHKLLADQLFNRGRLVEAEAHYRIAVDLDNRNVDFAYHLGNVLYYQSRLLEALAALKRALTLDPDFSAAHYRIGLSYHHLGQFEKAVEHFNTCCRLTPDYEMAHYHLGVVYAKMGKREEAMKEFSHHLDADFRDAATRGHLDILRGDINP